MSSKGRNSGHRRGGRRRRWKERTATGRRLADKVGLEVALFADPLLSTAVKAVRASGNGRAPGAVEGNGRAIGDAGLAGGKGDAGGQRREDDCRIVGYLVGSRVDHVKLVVLVNGLPSNVCQGEMIN